MMDKAFLRTLRVHLQKEALPKIVDESDLCEHIAQYVIAILGGRSSDPLEKLKETVKEKAREFLKDDTDDFTDDLFRYIEKNAPPPSESRAGSSNSRSKRKRSSNRDSSDRRRRYSPERENRDSRRESTRDRDSFKRKQRRSRYSERESREDRDSSKRDERDRKRDSDSRRSEREGEGGGGGRDHRDHRHRDDRGGGSRDRRNNGGRRLTITKRPQDPSRQEAPPRDTAGGSGRSDDSDGRGNDEEKPYDQERDRPDDRNPRHGWRGPEAMMRGGRRPPPMRGDFRHPPDNNNRGMGPGGRGAEDAPPWNEIRFNNMRQQERMREGGERGGRGGRGGGRGGAAAAAAAERETRGDFEMKIKKEKMLQIIQARVVQKSLENQKRLLKVLANKDLKAKMRTARERKARVESLEKEAAEAAAAKGDSTPTTGNGEGAGTSTLEIDSLPQELQERGEEGLSTLLAEHFKAFGTVDKIELVKTSEEGGDEEDTGVISSVRVVFSSTAEATRAAREGKKLKELELKMAVRLIASAD
eukprot:jgi/Bigna1/75958/fgenesh1_pg.38_\